MEQYLNVKQVCRYFGFSRTTLHRLRNDRTFPEAVKISHGRIAYRVSDLDKWAANRLEKRNANFEAV